MIPYAKPPRGLYLQDVLTLRGNTVFKMINFKIRVGVFFARLCTLMEKHSTLETLHTVHISTKRNKLSIYYMLQEKCIAIKRNITELLFGVNSPKCFPPTTAENHV